MKAVALAVLLALGLFAYRSAQAQGVAVDTQGDGGAMPVGNWWDELTPAAFMQLESEAAPARQAIEQETQAMQDQRNVTAFLTVISRAEGTDRAGDPYRVCFGYKHTINSFADHPAITGEWRGERLSDAHCRGAGLNPGCVSTAAGRYQIIRPTWQRIKKKTGLTSFSPASQDAACIELIKERGAFADVQAGRFTQAIEKCRKEWASLPGASYGQGERSAAWLVSAYRQAGGVVA